ncbi:MAG: hypothetical protein KA538_13960 [Azonexus sp.]|jgi:hypothetical protein|nr:hypothetical protein [Azonexus sp.]
MNTINATLEAALAAAVEDHASHRFGQVMFRGAEWCLAHLDPFAFHRPIDLGSTDGQPTILEVVVLFSCHCFTQGVERDEREAIPANEFYKRDGETRVLCEERYLLSIDLPAIVFALSTHRISVAKPGHNFVTFRRQTAAGEKHYGVFFQVMKARDRTHRIILRVQSAYLKEMTKREKTAKNVKLDTLLKAAYEGRTIRP